MKIYSDALKEKIICLPDNITKIKYIDKLRRNDKLYLKLPLKRAYINATAVTTGSANQRLNTPYIRLWIDVTFHGLEKLADKTPAC